MPVTAKLSKLFYDRLGEAIANELVDWFNQVDATYRSDLREINELNFARFDARMEQRIAQSEAALGRRIGESEARLERSINELRSALQGLDARIDAVNDRIVSRLDAALLRQTKFYFMAWAALLLALGVPIMGLWFR